MTRCTGNCTQGRHCTCAGPLITLLRNWWHARPLRRRLAGVDADMAHSRAEIQRLQQAITAGHLPHEDAVQAEAQIQLHGMALLVDRTRRARLCTELRALGQQA